MTQEDKHWMTTNEKLPADLTLGDVICGNCSSLKGFLKAQNVYSQALAIIQQQGDRIKSLEAASPKYFDGTKAYFQLAEQCKKAEQERDALKKQVEELQTSIEIQWEYEDKLPYLNGRMFEFSRVDGVRLYPYIETETGKYFIGEEH